MNDIMPAESGNPNPTDQLYPVTEAAELLLRGTGLHFRYNAAEAKRALRAAAEAGEVPVRRIDGRLAFAFSELDTPATIDAFLARLKGGASTNARAERLPDPVTQYAVKSRLDGWDGPSLVILTSSISDSQAYAERFLDPDGALVSGPSGTDPHTWEVVR